jgi:hypothetical protein
VGFLPDRYVREIEPLLVRAVVLYHRVIHDRRGMVVIDYGRFVYVGYLDRPVIVHTEKVGLVNYNRMVGIRIVPWAHIDLAHVGIGYDYVPAASPMVV